LINLFYYTAEISIMADPCSEEIGVKAHVTHSKSINKRVFMTTVLLRPFKIS